MTWERSLALAGRVSGAGRPVHQKTETSAVTTAWGVDWDEEFIARDILQNFYDANRGQLNEVAVAADGSDVTITAPATFPLEELLYLGSVKGKADVGQYGEGFKAAAMCLLRNHGVTPAVVSGGQILCIRIAEEKAAGTDLYPLVYDFFTTNVPCAGTRLFLPGCSPKLVRSLKVGLTHFFHPGNPLLGARLWGGRGSFTIYASTTDGEGHVFYRNLKRGDIPDIPVVLVIDKEHAAIEKKIKSDRDRNAFGAELLRDFYGVFTQNGIKQDREAAQALLKLAQPCWSRGQGHPLLERVANEFWEGAQLGSTVAHLFGTGYFAHSASKEWAEQLRYDTMEREWRGEGRVGLPGYFGKFGVVSAKRHFEDLEKKARQEAITTGSRRPSRAEQAGLDLLTGTLKEFAPDIWKVIARDDVGYTVARTEVILGELKQARSYRSLKVFLAEQIFVAEFAEAFAVFLHEHAHVFGYDGSRGFTDALTGLLGTVVRYRQALDGYEAQWARVCEEVVQERRGTQPADDEDWGLRFAAMNEGELRELLGRMPPVVLRGALESS